MKINPRIALVVFVAVASIVGIFLFTDRLPQDPAYHDFADQRAYFIVPNFANVASNLAFILVGLIGLRTAWRIQRRLVDYRLWAIFFGGVFATGFGSALYHLFPSNGTLVMDRLPMTVAFMALFSLLVSERIDQDIGRKMIWPLVGVGIGSVLYWYWTEYSGQGDLRPYALIQFLPLVLMLLILRLFPADHRVSKFLLYALTWYGFAKLLEQQDAHLFAITDQGISGHTLKHLAAAASAACLISYMRRTARGN